MTITDDQIEALAYEAGCHGDHEMRALCHAALEGDEAARDECRRVILDAAAQDDEAERVNLAGMTHGVAGRNEAAGYDLTPPEPCGHHCPWDCPRCGERD